MILFMTTTIIDEHLDNLAGQLRTYDLSLVYEETFVIMRHQDLQPVLLRVPNRHPDPKNHFRIYARDIRHYSKLGMSLVGYVHTHLPDDDEHDESELPSPEDFQSLSDDYLGGVYMVTGDTLYWYNHEKIIHTTTMRYQ
jgi:hypothetical protein